MKRLIKKYQRGKKTQVEEPNTFVGMIADVLGGDYKKWDQISAGASLIPLVGMITGALDTGYDANGIKYGTKNERDVILDIVSMIPGISQAKKINLLKKSSDPAMYYYKELRRYLKKYDDYINSGVGLGKAADSVDDATHR